jgi:hypothetical protein
MTVKEAIHQLIDQLPDDDADRVLAYLRSIRRASTIGTEHTQTVEKHVESLEWMKLGEPTSEHDPLWRIVGLVNQDGPTDVARNLDDYLAEALFDWKRR